MLALTLVLLSAGVPQAAPPAEAILSRPSADLARELAIPDAGDIVRHDLAPERGMVPPPAPGASPRATVRFYYPARSARSGVCSRDVAVAEVEWTDQGLRSVRPVRRQTELSLASDCRSAITDRFAWVNPNAAAVAADELVRLADIQRRVRQGRPAGVSVRCRSEFRSYSCPADPLEAVAALPLDRIYLIERDRSADGLSFVATEGEPGDLMWDIRLKADRLDIVRRIPPPF
jgi:hypothetical protein